MQSMDLDEPIKETDRFLSHTNIINHGSDSTHIVSFQSLDITYISRAFRPSGKIQLHQ